MERIMRFGSGEQPEIIIQEERPRWHGIGIPIPKYPLDVEGDINCTGIYRINGTPITAFTLGRGSQERINGIPGPVNILAGDNISIRVEGNNIIIDARVREYRPVPHPSDVRLEKGWKAYKPVFMDRMHKVPTVKSVGHYMVSDGACHIQAHVEVNEKLEGPFKISLPAASMGSVKQSLNIYSEHARVDYTVIQGSDLVFKTANPNIEKATFLVSGSYRVS